MEKKKYRIIIWDVKVRSKDMELDETELDTLVDKLKSKEVPPSFEVRELLEENWQKILYEHYTKEWYYINEKIND